MAHLHQYHVPGATPSEGADSRRGRSALGELLADPVVAVAAIWSALLAAMFVTYWRLAPAEYLHLTYEGVVGALSRIVMEINFPISLIAIVVVLLSLDRLSARWLVPGIVAIVLDLVTAFPGVVSSDDFDARWINALPAIGVAITITMAIAAGRRPAPPIPALPLDRLRVALGIVTVFVAAPLIAAILGFSLPNGVFIMEEATGADYAGEVAVHLGMHHGLDGALVVITMLVLSRAPVDHLGLRLGVRILVALLFGYGAVNLVQDSWNEQIVKRGWWDRTIESAYHPALEAVWIAVLATAVLAFAALQWEANRTRRSHPPRDR